MSKDYFLYKNQLIDIVRSGEVFISNIKPSEWVEQNIIMQKPFPGPFRYSRTPYTREIIDCLSPSHPARTIVVMKGAQIGFSAGVIIPGCAWIIKNDPGNTLFTVGSPNLVEKATEKLDIIITNAGLRDYIKPQVLRNRNNKSGDTNFKKEFAGGYIYIASANNHKDIRDMSLQYGFHDDFESVKSASKESGSTRKLLEQRYSAYADTHKTYWISTPEIKENSNIESAYLLGDQRKYFIPCPCCGNYIELIWSTPLKDDEKQMAGITWKVDAFNKIIPGSVGYVCQECGGFFDDKNKHYLLNQGFWKATAEPSKLGYYSYHLSSLYAPLGMYDWEHYVNDYLEAHPLNQKRKEPEYKSFVNLCLGQTYEEVGDSINSNELQKNISNYSINIIPEKISLKHGNGKIVLLTCACDLNGKLDDARLDYEIVAWAENGATYSIDHGSIGTFIPNESAKKNKVEREKWTYENHKENSVWKVLDKLLETIYKTDSDRKMKIFITGIDTGYCELQAFTYIDNCNHNVFGLKGDKEDKYVRHGIEVPNFKKGASREKLYLVRVGQVKDDLSHLINLNWDEGNDDSQPDGFMNFPIPSDGKYLYNNYFSHYEAEQRILDKDNNFIWQKKNAIAQNHLFDCRVYNLALRDILLNIIGKEMKVKSFEWIDFVDLTLGRK